MFQSVLVMYGLLVAYRTLRNECLPFTFIIFLLCAIQKKAFLIVQHL